MSKIQGIFIPHVILITWIWLIMEAIQPQLLRNNTIAQNWGGVGGSSMIFMARFRYILGLALSGTSGDCLFSFM